MSPDSLVALAFTVALAALLLDPWIEQWEKRQVIKRTIAEYQLYLQNPIDYEPER